MGESSTGQSVWEWRQPTQAEHPFPLSQRKSLLEGGGESCKLKGRQRQSPLRSPVPTASAPLGVSWFAPGPTHKRIGLPGPAPGGSGRPIVALGRRQSAFFPSSPHFPSLHVPEVSISSQSPSHPCRVRLPFVLGPSWQTTSQRKKSPELSSVRIRRIALQWPCPAPPHRLHLPPPPPLQLPLLQHQLWHVPQVRILRQTLDCVRPPCSHKWHWHGPNFSRPS